MDVAKVQVSAITIKVMWVDTHTHTRSAFNKPGVLRTLLGMLAGMQAGLLAGAGRLCMCFEG
jgi:hypothetical protein